MILFNTKALKSHPLSAIYCIYAVIAIISILNGPRPMPDTDSYYAAWDTVRHLRIDVFRTPVYPILLGSLRAIFGATYSNIAVMIAQFIIFGLSIRYFYDTISIIGRPGRLAFFTTLLYTISPATMLWATVIMTESLSISLLVMWIYTMVVIWQKGYRLKYAIAYSVTLTLLFMLRPSFVFLAPISVVYLLFYALKHRSRIMTLIKVGAFMCVPVVILFAYCMGFKAVYGTFSPSSVAYVNQLNLLRYGELIDFNENTDPALSVDIDKYMISDDVRLADTKFEYTLVDVDKAIKEHISHNLKPYIIYNYNHIYQLYDWSDDFFYFKTSALNSLLVLIGGINGKDIIFITVIFSIYVIYGWVKRRRPYISTILCMIIMANIITSIIGSHWELRRLCITCAPVLFLAIGMMLSNFKLTRRVFE